jgi:hypothetical protein
MKRAVVLAAALLAHAASARAGEEPRIVLVGQGPGDRVAVRIRAELRALHFEVDDADLGPGPPAREPLAEAARSRGAVAAVRLVPSGAGVEVWIVDRITGKTVLREIIADDPRSPTASATIALRVVELLRASLMELDAPRAPPGEVTPPAAAREMIAPPRPVATPPAPPAAKRPLASFEVGPALLLSPGGARPEGALLAAAHLWPQDRLGATLLLAAPVIPAAVSGPEGSASLHLGLLGVGLRAQLAPPEARWVPSLGAGLTALWMGYLGKPVSGYVGTSGDVFTAAPYLRAGVGVSVLPRLRLRADVMGGAALRRPMVRFGDRLAAVWGAPFFAPSVAAELSL